MNNSLALLLLLHQQVEIWGKRLYISATCCTGRHVLYAGRHVLYWPLRAVLAATRCMLAATRCMLAATRFRSSLWSTDRFPGLERQKGMFSVIVYLMNLRFFLSSIFGEKIFGEKRGCGPETTFEDAKEVASSVNDVVKCKLQHSYKEPATGFVFFSSLLLTRTPTPTGKLNASDKTRASYYRAGFARNCAQRWSHYSWAAFTSKQLNSAISLREHSK